MEDEEAEMFPILLDGKPYQIDPTGQFAINQNGKAVKLSDKERESWYR